MRRASHLLVLGVLIACAASVEAGEREWRDKRKTYDDALAKVEADRGKSADDSKKAMEDLRKAADAMLGEKGTQPKTVEHVLAHGFTSPKRPVAELALDLLKRVDDAKAQRDLLKAFEDAQGTTRQLLLEVVRILPGPDVTLTFVKLLRDRDELVRLGAARALGSRGADARAAAEPPLTKALKDDSIAVRFAAARSLETL